MTPAAIPFGRTRLYKWLAMIGLEQNEVLSQCLFTALVGIYPGKAKHGDLKPSITEIKKFRPHLASMLAQVPEAVVVPVGSMAISELLGCPVQNISDFVGKRFEVRLFGTSQLRVVVPLPHPSGGSVWPHIPGNMALLEQALKILKREILPFNAKAG